MKMKATRARKNMPRYRDQIPKGRNKMKLKDRFQEFDRYENSVPTGYNYGPNLANLRDPLRVLYGKVDFHGMPVKPKKQYLKQLFTPTSDKTFFALDFVADLFKEMLLYIEESRSRGTIEEDSVYSNIKPARAWVDVDSLYEEYIIKFDTEVMNSITRDATLERTLINYEKFEKYYIAQAIHSSKNRRPYTKTEFALSAYCDRLYTGLSIDIADTANCANDTEKYLIFIRDTNFPNMRQIAGRFGFRMDFNAPWRFHCDLNSPVVQQKLQLRGIHSFDEFFKRFYDTIHVDFIDQLKESMVNIYNFFAVNNDSYEEMYMCQRSGDLKVKIHQRYEIDQAAVDVKPRTHWYRAYLKIRAAERNKTFNKYEEDRIVKLAADYDLARGGSTGEDLIEVYFIDRIDEVFKDGLTVNKLYGMMEEINNLGQY